MWVKWPWGKKYILRVSNCLHMLPPCICGQFGSNGICSTAIFILTVCCNRIAEQNCFSGRIFWGGLEGFHNVLFGLELM